jgi:hypothetical protein
MNFQKSKVNGIVDVASFSVYFLTIDMEDGTILIQTDGIEHRYVFEDLVQISPSADVSCFTLRFKD